MNRFGLTDSERELIQGVLRRRPEVAKAKIFGSRAKGNAQPHSDADLALWGNISFAALAAIAGGLDELPLPYTFDVQAYEALRHAPLREHIDRAGQGFYKREPKKVVPKTRSLKMQLRELSEGSQRLNFNAEKQRKFIDKPSRPVPTPMPNKLAPPPPVAPETWSALLASAAEFHALKPWEFAYDSEPVGLIDLLSGETRIGHVLGHAGEVFAAVFYRREGLRWILSRLDDSFDSGNMNAADGIDCLKVEFVVKRELWKEDLAVIKAAAFKPVGRGTVWPQFRSCEPGWHPWHIDQTEADQLLTDLPRLTAFYKMFEQHSGLFDNRPPTEIPFPPVPLPARPLAPGDLDWHPLLPLPFTGFGPFRVSSEELEKLRALKFMPRSGFEFDNTLLPGGSFLENGRPCYGRFGLLVERQRGMVVGMDVVSGALAPGEAAGRTLVKALLMSNQLPGAIFINNPCLQPVLQPLCDELQIQLTPAPSLPALEEALESLYRHMLGEDDPERI